MTYLRGDTYLPNGLSLQRASTGKYPSKRVNLVHHLNEMELLLAIKYVKICTLGIDNNHSTLSNFCNLS